MGFGKDGVCLLIIFPICLFISWKMLELQTTLQYFLLNANVMSGY